jgi:NAD(P)-dependent dehydrogenase (short-subunit alcohol dehydrogenase family)
VNNAGYGQLGFFEENTLEEAREQFDTNLFGVFNVTWAVLPVMRAARSGRIFNISSSGGIRGSMTGSIYCATKFGVEGFTEALAQEVESLGIHLTIVEPGLFKTEFLSPNSVRFGSRSIDDYAAQSAKLQEMYRGLSGQQKGDPKKLAQALMRLANETHPPLRFAAGADAVATVEDKMSAVLRDLEQWRDLSLSTEG